MPDVMALQTMRQGDDASATQRLLPSGDHPYRRSLDQDEIAAQKERYHDDDDDSSTTRAEEQPHVHLPRRQTYLRRNLPWVLVVVLSFFLALAVLALLFRPPLPSMSSNGSASKADATAVVIHTPTPKPKPAPDKPKPNKPKPTRIAIDHYPSWGPPPAHDKPPIFSKPPSWYKSSDTDDDLSVSGFSGPRNEITFLNGTKFVQPPHMKIIGIIFYGRRQFVNVLDCYLRRNLKVNGGILDEIHFLMHTDVEEDVDWMRRLVKTDGLADYYKLKMEKTGGKWSLWGTFDDLYKKFMSDEDAIYVKMDDDMLFIDDYCIAEMVRAVLEHPEAHSIQANIINNKWNYWHHLRTGAIWPFLAETDTSSKWPEGSWRPSELPKYPDAPPGEDFEFVKMKPPNPGHRWLPLEPTYENLRLSPMGGELRNPMFKTKPKINGWAVTTQCHMSFFENHERGELHRYSYGSPLDRMWNLWYSRYNINMMAMRGSYIVNKNPVWNQRYKQHHKGDEFLLTKIIPRELDMPVLVATRAIAAHFSFRGEREEMLESDILDRYRALANDVYCDAGNHRPRMSINKHHILDTEGVQGDGTKEKIGDGPQDIANYDDDDGDDDHGT